MQRGRSRILIFIKQMFAAAIGLASGGIIAAGVFAFLAVIGVFPRLIGKTKTWNHLSLYETVIILGGTFGNVMDIYEFPIPIAQRVYSILGEGAGIAAGGMVTGIIGVCIGIFVGCLVMSLAETLQALPVFSRRIHLAVGFQYVILSIALGKLMGSLIYFVTGIGERIGVG